MRSAVFLAITGIVVISLGLAGCSRGSMQETPQLRQAREEMAARLQRSGVVTNPRVINAMRLLPRQAFVPESLWEYAYSDQTVTAADGTPLLSSPLLAGLVMQEMNPMPRHTVLMVDPPDAYLPALASRLCRRVVVIMLLETEAARIEDQARAVGSTNVEAHGCDVAQGWAAAAPYNSVLFGYDPGRVPPKIVEQADNRGVIAIVDGAAAAAVKVMQVKDDEVSAPRVVAIPSGA